jgi:hypothetical protein
MLSKRYLHTPSKIPHAQALARVSALRLSFRTGLTPDRTVLPDSTHALRSVVAQPDSMF